MIRNEYKTIYKRMLRTITQQKNHIMIVRRPTMLVRRPIMLVRRPILSNSPFYANMSHLKFRMHMYCNQVVSCKKIEYLCSYIEELISFINNYLGTLRLQQFVEKHVGFNKHKLVFVNPPTVSTYMYLQVALLYIKMYLRHTYYIKKYHDDCLRGQVFIPWIH